MKKLVCEICKGTNIEMRAWIDPNTNEVKQSCDCGRDDNWCNDCQENVYFLSKKVKKQKRKPKNEVEIPQADFTKISKRHFDKHLYGNTSRCKYKNQILSFFSSDEDVEGLFLFCFSYQRRYYSAFRDKTLPDAILEKQIMDVLFPENKSFHYKGWLCKYNANDSMFHLYTPEEMEQLAGFRICEMELSTPIQAIEFINHY